MYIYIVYVLFLIIRTLMNLYVFEIAYKEINMSDPVDRKFWSTVRIIYGHIL